MKLIKDYVRSNLASKYLKVFRQEIWDMGRSGKIVTYDRLFGKDPRFSIKSLEEEARKKFGDSFVPYDVWVKSYTQKKMHQGELTCKYCGKKFVGSVSVTKYCSVKCRYEFNRIIQKNRYDEERELDKSNLELWDGLREGRKRKTFL